MSLLAALNLPERNSRRAPGRAAPGGRGDAPAAPPIGDAVPAPPVTVEVADGPASTSLQTDGNQAAFGIKYELKKLQAPPISFMIGSVPCYTKAYATLSAGDEVAIDRREGSLGGTRQIKVSGTLELGIGATIKGFTAGPYGAATLSGGVGLAVKVDKSLEVAAAATLEVVGVGSVGIKVELGERSVGVDVELQRWKLFVVSIGGCTGGRFQDLHIANGPDIGRLIAALQNAGARIADAVDEYAPESVKKAAEDGAKWAAESPTAKKIADGTGVVLDKVKEQTGKDVGNAAEELVRDLVDPGGETANETTARVNAEIDASHESVNDFHAVMRANGLEKGGPLGSRTAAETAEYNAISDAKQAGQDWRAMVGPLVAKRIARRAQEAKEAETKRKKEKEEADAAAAADMARRVAASEARMAEAERQANALGIPLNNRTLNTPHSNARKKYLEGMRFRDQGLSIKLQLPTLEGEARIAKADQAAALFSKARPIFEQATHLRD